MCRPPPVARHAGVRKSRSFPWLVLVIQASAGSLVAGLVAAAWLLGRQRNDPIPCFLDRCETQISLSIVSVTLTYFIASVAAGLALAVSELTGPAGARARVWLAVIGPPAMWIALSL